MTPRLTLGPIAYHWPAERKRDFYAAIADEAPVDTVYLGEVICSKRAPFFDAELPEVAERLRRGGKTVVFSSLAEIILKRERTAMRELCEIDGFEIEINNAAGLYHRSGRPHRIGPFLNVYNEQTLAHLAGHGATHVCLPVELPSAAAGVIAEAAAGLGVGVEVQVFGRAPLALSARCYHARAHGRTRDNCQFVCEEDPDGMALTTMDGEPFLRINGIQTMSQSYVCLTEEAPGLAAVGITDLRLMPQDIDMVAVARVFADVLGGALAPDAAAERLEALAVAVPFSNGFWHGEAGHRRIAARARELS